MLVAGKYNYDFVFTNSFNTVTVTLTVPLQTKSVIGRNNTVVGSTVVNAVASPNNNITETDCICCGGETDPSNPNLQRAPLIYMTIQTTLKGTDISEALFTVCDDFDYKRNKLKHSRCNQNRFVPKTSIIPSNFDRNDPFIDHIIIGKGNGLTEKAKYLQARGATNIAVAPLTEYAMAKYILARVMYGDFNINYLLRNFNKKFMKDLSNSRFCRFIEFFALPQYKGYYKFFKSEEVNRDHRKQQW